MQLLKQHKLLMIVCVPICLIGVFGVYISLQKIAAADYLLSDSQTVLPPAEERLHPFVVAYQAHENALLIDIRTPQEYASGHLPGALNVDYYDPLFTQTIRTLAKDRTVFMYCRSGNRSSDAYRRLTAQGLMVEEMDGGILSYRGELQKN